MDAEVSVSAKLCLPLSRPVSSKLTPKSTSVVLGIDRLQIVNRTICTSPIVIISWARMFGGNL